MAESGVETGSDRSVEWMGADLSPVLEFIQHNQVWLGWLGVASVATLIVTPIVTAWFLIQLPENYFVSRSSRVPVDRQPLLHALYVIVKNVLGSLFVLIGIAMLVLPGQGLLSILVGILLLDFPAKYRLERWLMKKPSISKGINWLRYKAKRPPFLLD